MARKLARKTRRRQNKRRKTVRRMRSMRGGLCQCLMRGGDGVGAPTIEKADGVPVPHNGLVGVPGASGSMDIEQYKEYFGGVMDGNIVPESRDF